MPLDICLLDVAVALNANQGANYLVSGVAPKRSGNAHPNCAPYEVFACADGHLILAIGNDGQFARFCGVVGHPEWAADARYATNSARLANMDSLRPQVAAALAAAPRQRWTDAFDDAGVPWGPIHTLDEVFAHPQVRHRELLQTTTHPVLGEVRLVRNPLLAGTPASALGAAPPLLGEHTDAVLTNSATI
jgi:crotonobetainyl-CoA:carnitine CoA-transferase CaiB-like acyl-CoA transferase